MINKKEGLRFAVKIIMTSTIINDIPSDSSKPNETISDEEDDTEEFIEEVSKHISNDTWDYDNEVSFWFKTASSRLKKLPLPNVPNLILINCKVYNANYQPADVPGLYEFIENTFYSDIGLLSMQQTLLQKLEFSDNLAYIDWISTTSAGCYIDSINPALVIILNHISFADLALRPESLKDVNNLTRIFMMKKTPIIRIKDGTLENVQSIFKFLQNNDLSAFKDIYIFIMSHGEENDIIFTKNGQYSIYENIKLLMENATLKDTNKILVSCACRGTIDPTFDALSEEEAFKNETDATLLDQKTAVFHSVPKHYISIRDKKGAVFIQWICKLLALPFEEYSVDELAAHIDESLEQCEFYYWYGTYGEKKWDYVKQPEAKITLKIKLDDLAKLKTSIQNLTTDLDLRQKSFKIKSQ